MNDNVRMPRKLLTAIHGSYKNMIAEFASTGRYDAETMAALEQWEGQLAGFLSEDTTPSGDTTLKPTQESIMTTESMSEMFVLDATGHGSVIKWGKTAGEIEAAQAAFDEYKRRGFTMFVLTKDDEQGRRLDEFDENVRGILAVPRMQGG